MAPQLLFDLAGIGLDRVIQGPDEIERINPHRGVMRLLDGILYESEDSTRVVAYKDIGSDEFWVAGHIPDRPIFPGVLMIEAAAQLASYQTLRKLKDECFLGFVAADGVKFRGQVGPGSRFLVLGKLAEMRRRRAIWDTQGLVDGNLVFEAKITGMPM